MGPITTLSALDIFILVVFAASITGIGLYFTRLQKTTKDYFLGGKNIPWWAVTISIVAAETSAATVIAAPAWAYDPKGGSMVFLQLTFGYLMARILIALIFVPTLLRKEYFSVYNYLQDRFGPSARSIAGLVFFFTRCLASGIRIYIPAIIIQQMIPSLAFHYCVIISVGIGLLYTSFGGFRAVVWTDLLMFCIYWLGGLLAILTVLHYIPLSRVMEIASEGGKFRLFNFDIFNFKENYTILSGFIGGTFLSMATHGTDQSIAQKLLACRNKTDSQRAIIGSGVIIIPQFVFFLLLGVFLFAFYKIQGFPALEKTDRILPHFIVTTMPHGLIGLIIAAILAASMSTTSNEMLSLTNISINDFYRRIFRPQATEKETLIVSKIMLVIWCIILVFIAFLPKLLPEWRLLDICLAIPSLFYGSLLGVFLLGFLTKRATETGAIIGALLGLIVVLAVALPPQLASWFPQSMPAFFKTYPKIAFPWWCPLGTLTTMISGYLLSLILTGAKRQKPNA